MLWWYQRYVWGDGDSVSTLFTFKIYQTMSEIGTLSLERQDNGA